MADKLPQSDAAPPGLAKLLANNDIVFAAGVALILVALVIPLPTFLLDMLLSVSLAVALATLCIVLSTKESIEFSTFPSLLLCVTLMRLSLNVASTRLILLNGNAGQIIATFGQFVVGGNLVIGLVVFLILVVIQFVVITKGAERISEVAARFNLDAMPGKQMAIDADLNAGLIGEQEARDRRQKIVRESEFYGSMDGASKFIRGDAIASLIIAAVNLVGGFTMGMMNGMTATEAVHTYAILAIGDALVTQIPAVIISTASGFLVSKTTSANSLSADLLRQFLSKRRALGIAAFLFGAMIFVPGFPKTPFAALAIGTGLLVRYMGRQERAAVAAREKAKPALAADGASVEELLDVDKVSILVGPRLIRTVDPRRKSSLSHRIGPLRSKFAREYGIILPLVRLRDNVALDANAYEIRLHDHVVASGSLEPEMLLAMDGGAVENPIAGMAAREPVFGLPALWVMPDQKDKAELAGYTVVDPETVLMTHLSEVLRTHAHELLSRDDVQKLVDRLREKQPALVNGVLGEAVPVGLLHRVLQSLLRDRVAIRDLALVLEALGANAGRTKDPAVLTELARKALVRTITESHQDASGKIQAVIFEPALEYELRAGVTREGDQETLALGSERSLALTNQVAAAFRAAMDQGHDKTVVLCDSRLRPHLAGLFARQLPQLPVVAYDEIAIGTRIQSVGQIAAAAPQLARE